MAYSQDYIKRMLEQFGEFLLALKRKLLMSNMKTRSKKSTKRSKQCSAWTRTLLPMRLMTTWC